MSVIIFLPTSHFAIFGVLFICLLVWCRYVSSLFVRFPLQHPRFDVWNFICQTSFFKEIFVCFVWVLILDSIAHLIGQKMHTWSDEGVYYRLSPCLHISLKRQSSKFNPFTCRFLFCLFQVQMFFVLLFVSCSLTPLLSPSLGKGNASKRFFLFLLKYNCLTSSLPLSLAFSLRATWVVLPIRPFSCSTPMIRFRSPFKPSSIQPCPSWMRVVSKLPLISRGGKKVTVIALRCCEWGTWIDDVR